MLSQQLLEIAAHVAPSVPTWPRRKPGLFMAGSKIIRYADLHSFYHQIRQIFGQRLYNFRSDSAAPVILDCGAHTGLASLYFKERFPAARITAFEADGDLADMCRVNFETFDAADVEVVPAAVWTHNDGVSFVQSADDAGHVASTSDSAAIKVPSVRLSSYLATPIDLLKLDVEGAEFALIEDCVAQLSNVKNIVMEVHAMEDTQARIGPLLARLEDSGFTYVLGDLHQATWVPCAKAPPFEYCRTSKFIMTVFAWRP